MLRASTPREEEKKEKEKEEGVGGGRGGGKFDKVNGCFKPKPCASIAEHTHTHTHTSTAHFLTCMRNVVCIIIMVTIVITRVGTNMIAHDCSCFSN